MSLDIRSEFAAADLGDARLTARLCAMAESLSAAPEMSFPKAFGTEAAREGGYRLLNHESVSIEKVLGPHIEQTVKRAEQKECVAVIHDTTEFRFRGETHRRGLGRLQQKGQGFFAHTALVVSADGRREPLGVLGVETLFRLQPPKGKRTPSQLRKDPNNEALRWQRLSLQTNRLLQGKAEAIHLMDREADSYDMLLFFAEQNIRFVVRAAHDRMVESLDKKAHLRESLESAPVMLEREVPISYRSGKKTAKQRRIHPGREGRVAKLCFSAQAVEMQRPKHASHKQRAKVAVHVVRVWEIDCPAELHPVEWILLTTEPIESHADVARIVDLYRSRWMIEEFFKALKTGCAYEQRQLESSHALLNALGLFMPIAWRLLLLRTLSRQTDSQAPATEALPESQVEALIAMRRGKLSTNPTVREAMLAIAAIGGHIKNNGEPGWLVLWRGYRDLLLFEAGWSAATSRQRCDQS